MKRYKYLSILYGFSLLCTYQFTALASEDSLELSSDSVVSSEDKTLGDYAKASSDTIPSSANTIATIDFSDKGVPDGVIPPDDPGGFPITPPDTGGRPGDGPSEFNLSWVSDLNFGGVELLDQTMYKYAEPLTFNNKSNYAPFIQIVDQRKVPSEWKVSVTASDFEAVTGVDTSNYDQVLKGVLINFKNAVVIDSLDLGKTTMPEVHLGSQLATGDMTLDIVSADRLSSRGIWTVSFTDDQKGYYNKNAGVQVEIPASLSPEFSTTYESDVVWTLSANPI